MPDEKPTYRIDGDMPPLAETGKPGLLPPNQSVGAAAGSPGQIYAGDDMTGTSVSSGMIPVDDRIDLEEQRIRAWSQVPWLKWLGAGVIAGAAGHYGYLKWKKRR